MSFSGSNIIVRPQWLHRCNQSSTGFRAQFTSQLVDKEGGEDYFPYTPIVFFINKDSGGHKGEEIYRKFLRKLNPRQIFLLTNNAVITNAIDMYYLLPNIRLCVMGGDGTVNWVLSCLVNSLPPNKRPPVGVFPLGTCNDLSRTLG